MSEKVERSRLRPRVVRWPGAEHPGGNKEALCQWLQARFGATSFYTDRLGLGFPFVTRFSYG